MKKFLVLMTLFTAILPASSAYAMLGDANADGQIDASDAALTLQYVLNSEALAESAYDVDAMMVTEDDIITADNAAKILEKASFLDYRFPSTYVTLDADAQSSLKKVILALDNRAIPNEAEGINKEILTIVKDEMYEYYYDNSYDIESGITKAQDLIATLSKEERQELKSTILTYCDVNDLEKLYDFFGFLVG